MLETGKLPEIPVDLFSGEVAKTLESLAEGPNTPPQSGHTSTVVKSHTQGRGRTGQLKKGSF